LGAGVVVFAIPLAVGLGIAGFRKWEWWNREVMGRLTRIHPAPTAWDFAFSDGGPFFVRVRLRDGERLGGIFGAASFATSYPERQDLYLEEAWRLDEKGSFVEPVPESAGLLILRENVDHVELLSASAEEVETSG
jgi:hypothetical protein